jgi:hypothetical protein
MNNNLSENERLLLNTLITMYNDNTRQIENLTVSNNEIRNTIIDTLNMLRNNRTESNQNTRNTRSTTRVNRQLLNNPYVFDYVQEFTIPINYTSPNQNLTNNNTSRNNMLNQINNLFQTFMNHVEVFPTMEQIETATRNVRYGDIVRPTNNSCPISLDTFNENDNVTVIRQCGHIFKTESLNTWFQSNCVCPVCRYDIREYIHNNNV